MQVAIPLANTLPGDGEQLFKLRKTVMKKVLFFIVTSMFLIDSACFLDTKKSNNNSVLLLLLMNPNPSTVPMTGVGLNKTSTMITKSGTEQLTATLAPSNATNKNVIWSSSDETTATVNASGLVTAVSYGPASITVTTADGGFSSTCAVTVVFTEKNTGYDNSNNIIYYAESTYPSSAAYLQSQTTNINNRLYPTPIEINALSGSLTSKMSFGIGTDGKWFTADDTFIQGDELRPISTAVSRFIIYSNFTGTVMGYYEYQFDGVGRVIKRTYYNGKGTDGQWFTIDDVKANNSNDSILVTTWSDNDNCATIGYDTDGITVLRRYTARRDSGANTITYKTFQADGTTQINAQAFNFTSNRSILYSTNMTTVTSYSTYSLNSLNEKITETIYTGAGADTIWFTGDDSVMMYGEIVFDADGYSTGGTIYTNPSKTTQIGHFAVAH